MGEEEIEVSENRTFRFLKWFGPGVLALWLFLGDGFLLVFGAGICWMWLMTRTLLDPDLRRRYPPFFRLLAVVGPSILATLFWFGYDSATPALLDAKAYVESRTDALDGSAVIEEFGVLRSFEAWLMVRDASGAVTLDKERSSRSNRTDERRQNRVPRYPVCQIQRLCWPAKTISLRRSLLQPPMPDARCTRK